MLKIYRLSLPRVGITTNIPSPDFSPVTTMSDNVVCFGFILPLANRFGRRMGFCELINLQDPLAHFQQTVIS